MMQSPTQLPPTVVVERRVSQESLQPQKSNKQSRTYDEEELRLLDSVKQMKQQDKKDLTETIDSTLIKHRKELLDELYKTIDQRVSTLANELALYTGKHDIIVPIFKANVSDLYSQLSSLNTKLIEAQTSISLSNIERENLQTFVQNRLESITKDLENIQKNMLAKSNHELEHKKQQSEQSCSNCRILQDQITLHAESIKDLYQQISDLRKEQSQASASSDSGATFIKYVAMAGILALFIGTVASSAKIMAIINHMLNQQIGL
jgi:hypothetical protein